MYPSKSTAVATLLLAVAWCCGSTLSAQELAWKFSTGEKWLVTHTSETKSTTTVNGKTTKDRLETEVDVRWTIDAVTAETAQVTQQITRLKLLTNSETGSDLLYDSADPEKPTGPAKDVAAAVQPLLDAKISCTVNARGEVSNITGTDKLPSAANSGGKSNGWVLNLLEQPLAFLPGKATKVNETWQRVRPLELPWGQFEQTQEFKLTGHNVEKSTADIAVIVAMKRKSGTSKTVTKNQEIQGTITFDLTAGRLHESETTQRLTTSTPYRGGEIVVQMHCVNRIALLKE